MSPKKSSSDQITKSDLSEFRKKIEKDSLSQLLANTVSNVGIERTTINRKALNQVNHLFEKKIDDWDVMDQKQSGRCWIFAGMNLYKPAICKKLKVKDIKLSANFVQFWDFFEKSNLFLNNIEQTAEKPVDERIVQCILGTSLEGGWWDMFSVLVKKYGIVPAEAMPDTVDSERPVALCKILLTYLRTQAMHLRTLIAKKNPASEINKLKKDTLENIYRLLTIHLGTPPQKFSWTYENKNGKICHLKNKTPLQFISDFDNPECVTLINDPRKERPFKKHYTCKFTGSIYGSQLDFLNVDIKTLKKYARKMIDSGRNVWMSADMNKPIDHKVGLFAEDLYNYSEVLNIPPPMSKADRINYCDGGANHAMLFTGYHTENGKVTKWRVENSWGDNKGKKGYYEMTDEWFEEHVYTSLICKEFLSKDLLKILNEPAVVVMPWELPY